jgi:thioesterase DpgC
MVLTIEPQTLADVGLSAAALEQWAALDPRRQPPAGFAATAEAASRFLLAGEGLYGQLPPRPARSDREQAAAEALMGHLRAVRRAFLGRYAADLYAELTHGQQRFVRVEDLVYLAAERVPGLAPSRAQVQADRAHPQKDKEGYEVDQGHLLAAMLAVPSCGLHLVYGMLRPRAEALDLLPAFQRDGRLEIGSTIVERQGRVGTVLHGNPRFLNAEDDPTTASLEIATDLVLLDPTIEVCVLRGQPACHPKYDGRRLFSAGINLTHLYYGQISFVDFFIVREMGLVNKIYRGLASEDTFDPLGVEDTDEKPWLAAVEGFAIGGGCQLLLVMDYVLAEESSYFNLPARKEGIIPGASNMRLWRFVGDRLARQAILFDRQFPASSPEGRLICDAVVPDGQMDAALGRTIDGFLGSGVVSAAGNRKAIRIGQEPLDLFRQYMVVYCREQAACHYSPQLIRNLEQNWAADRRRL